MCKVNGCDQKHEGLGFCKKHYSRFLRHGDPLVVKTTALPLDDELIAELYLNLNQTAMTIGRRLGVSYQCIIDRLRKIGIKIRPAKPLPGSLRLEANPNWHGGTKLDRGYISVLLPSDHQFKSMANSHGYVRRNRLVMAQRLGRPLLASEVVHHVDHNKLNDAENNLKLFASSSEHARHHEAEKRLAAYKAMGGDE